MDENDHKTLPNIVKHGRSAYVRGCRCNDCRSGNRNYQREYMKNWRQSRRTAAVGSRPNSDSVGFADGRGQSEETQRTQTTAETDK